MHNTREEEDFTQVQIENKKIMIKSLVEFSVKFYFSSQGIQPRDLRNFHFFFFLNSLTDNGYIEGKELDEFFRHMMKRLGPQVSHLCLDEFILNL